MNLDQRISAFGRLGALLRKEESNLLLDLAPKAANENPWFTSDNVFLAIQGLQIMLDEQKIRSWIAQYPGSGQPKTVGVAFAGNIPMVGFHDLLCILMAGHRLQGRFSSKDSVLMKYMVTRLIELEPAFAGRIIWSDHLKGVDAVIATGSDNTSRYFEYYFRNIPHIIRKNRTSCAVIRGTESLAEWHDLGKDIFSYFGLGCRNVSKVLVPTGFDLTKLVEGWRSFEGVAQHHKYVNNLDYQKSLLLINRTPFIDGGFFLLKEDTQLASPISVIYYEQYESLGSLTGKLTAFSDKLQVVVSSDAWYEGSIPFGTAQLPELDDYADGRDTMEFLTRL